MVRFISVCNHQSHSNSEARGKTDQNINDLYTLHTCRYHRDMVTRCFFHFASVSSRHFGSLTKMPFSCIFAFVFITIAQLKTLYKNSDR